jgi:hypothetical protein
MRMRWLLATALGALLLALPAQAAQGTGSATQTISLVSKTVNFRLAVDRSPKGLPNKGDVLREESVLSNHVPQFGKRKGANVGSDVGIYTVVAMNPIRMKLKVTVRLPGGTLRSTGSIVGTDLATLRVVGGTGDFANARGTGKVREHNGARPGVLNVYRLQLP